MRSEDDGTKGIESTGTSDTHDAHAPPMDPEPQPDPNRSWLVWFIANWLVADPNFTKDTKKTYQAQPKEQFRYIYLFGGRLRTAKQTPITVGVALSIIVTGVLFWVYEAKWVWDNISPAVTIIFSYLWLLMATMYIKAGYSDPGILPRNIHLPFDLRNSSPETQPVPTEYFNSISLPYFEQQTKGVTVKYCPTCHVWRPPRTSHCGTCNVCVVNHDHHCKYLNNCVGLRNYKYFLWFILTAVLCCVIVIVTSFVQIFHYRIDHEFDSFNLSISNYPASFFLAILSCLLLIYPLLLLFLHMVLTSQNLTTREYLNNVRPDKAFVNVFDHKSVLRNLYINWVGKTRGRALFGVREEYNVDDIRMHSVPKLE